MRRWRCGVLPTPDKESLGVPPAWFPGLAWMCAPTVTVVR